MPLSSTPTADRQQLPAWLAADMAWLGSAVGLLADCPDSLDLIRQTCAALGRPVDEDVSPMSGEQLSLLTDRRHGPLGRYFEALVQTVIHLSPQVDGFHPNVVIHNGERTLGELDLLYRRTGPHNANQWIHLELAVKYYLGAGDRHDPFGWHGPALRDTLGRKLSRLFDHQLRLPETDTGKEVLEKLGVGDVQSEALVLGMLFHPLDQWRYGNRDAPPMIAKDHPAGWWLRRQDMHELDDISHMQETMWRVLSKPEWLAPADSPDENLSDLDVLSEHLNTVAHQHPVMVAALVDGHERHRGFVVPDDWGPRAS